MRESIRDWNFSERRSSAGFGSQAEVTDSAPLLTKKITDVQEKIFGETTDYTKMKAFYNDYVMKKFPEIEENIARAGDSLLRAIQYSMTGNYIDFGALAEVDKDKFEQLLVNVPNIEINDLEFKTLKKELEHAERLVLRITVCIWSSTAPWTKSLTPA